MTFTRGQRDVLERVLGADKMVRPNWFVRNFKKENLISYGLCYGLLALLAWETFGADRSGLATSAASASSASWLCRCCSASSCSSC